MEQETLESLLPRGWFTVEVGSPLSDVPLRQALAWWQQFATQGMADVRLPQGDLTFDVIERWSAVLLQATAVAFSFDGTPTPDAGIGYDSDYGLRLSWSDSWTKDHHAAVVVHPDDVGGVGRVTCLWDSGTGKQSKYLNIEELVASMGDFVLYDWGCEVGKGD